MAKTTVNGGPSDIYQEDPDHPAYMPEYHEDVETTEVEQEKETAEVESSVGHSSSQSHEKTQSSDESKKLPVPKHVRTTGNRS